MTPADIAHSLLAVIVADVQPPPDAASLVGLRAALRRQVVAVGPTVAQAAMHRLAAAPGPAGIDLRRNRFAGIAAALSSAPQAATATARPRHLGGLR